MKKRIIAILLLLALCVMSPCTVMTYAGQAMTISQNGLNLIESCERFEATAYKSLPSERYYTIGYGHYGVDVKKDMTITRKQGEELLRRDLEKSVASVNRFLSSNGISVNQNQFDALVSFTYNCGNYVWVRKKEFTLRTMLQKGISNYTDAQIRAAFTSWNKSSRGVVEGLTRRRNKETTLFLQGRVTAKPKPRFTPDLSSYRVSYRRVLYVNEDASASYRFKGTDVKYLQACLHYLGYDVSYDGVFGSGTADAVRRFQSHHALTQDGKCGRATWSAIEKAVGAYPSVSSVSSVAVKKKPSKLSYTMGDTLDTTGLKLTASYTNNTTKEITSGFTCTPTKLNTPGTQKITVTYNGKTTTFDVTVKRITSSIEIKSKPAKLSYTMGDTLDTTGLQLTAYYTNNTSKKITSGFTCTPTKLNTPGTQKITVKYNGKTTSFNVTVKRITSSIEIKSKPTKLSYNMGDTLDTTGLKLTAHYTNNTTKEITSGFTCTPTKLNTPGTQKITVKYNGKTTTFDVTVKRITSSIEIKSKPTKLTYTKGDTLNTKGLTLTAHYTNNTTKEITSGFTCTPTKLTTAGTQKITVKYNGKTTTFNVTVK